MSLINEPVVILLKNGFLGLWTLHYNWESSCFPSLLLWDCLESLKNIWGIRFKPGMGKNQIRSCGHSWERCGWSGSGGNWDGWRSMGIRRHPPVSFLNRRKRRQGGVGFRWRVVNNNGLRLSSSIGVGLHRQIWQHRQSSCLMLCISWRIWEADWWVNKKEKCCADKLYFWIN